MHHQRCLRAYDSPAHARPFGAPLQNRTKKVRSELLCPCPARAMPVTAHTREYLSVRCLRPARSQREPSHASQFHGGDHVLYAYPQLDFSHLNANEATKYSG